MLFFKNKTIKKLYNFLRENYLRLTIALIFIVGAISTYYIINVDSTEETTTVQRSNQDINYAIKKPKSLNPLTTNDETLYSINQLVYDGLFNFDENHSVVNAIASEYERLDERTIKIGLSRDIVFSDDEGITASDVVF